MPDTFVPGKWVPPLKRHNIYVNTQRVWSSDDWPPFGILDTVSRIATQEGLMWEFLDEFGRAIGY